MIVCFPDPSFYRSIVGSLQYLTITRLDISFMVNTACQHMHELRNSHFQAVKKILRYLQGMGSLLLRYTLGLLSLHGFSDAD